MLYPLKFTPVYKPKLWGGTKLNSLYGRITGSEKTGESWEICCRDDGMSVVENGKFQGKTLLEMIDTFKDKLLGKKIYQKYGGDLPLFFKIIDANDQLSVQVHPDDARAALSGDKYGKDEMWYIIDAKENASLIYGLKKNTSRVDLEKAIEEGRVSQLLNEVTVNPGDFIYIPAGTVHAIMDGILIAEIQQNSNTTYRIYDWDRTDETGKKRELQIEQALDAINFENNHPGPLSYSKLDCQVEATFRKGPAVRDFQVHEVVLNGSLEQQTDSEGFQVVMNLCGYGKIRYDGGCLDLSPGETIMIPACLGQYCLTGELKFLLVK